MRTRFLQLSAWGGALLGLSLVAVALWRPPADFPASWLSAFSMLINWPLGSMALLLVHALTGGRWGTLLRPALMASLSTLPLVALAAVPYALSVRFLYPWLQASGERLPNAFYLNGPFFTGRGLCYLALWLGLGMLILRAERRSSNKPLARLAPFGLIVLALTGTFASIDLTLSLDPHFASSIYGLIALVSMGLTALAAALLLTAVGSELEADALQALGRILQGLVLLWGYLDFMQLLILWQSNLVQDAPWYLLRARGSWGTTGLLITACHLLLPVGILLWTPARRSLTCIAGAASLLLVAEICRAAWLVLPAFRPAPHLADAGAMLVVLGTTSGTVLAVFGKRRIASEARYARI